MNYKTFYDRHWRLVWATILVAPPALLALGCLLWPGVIWDGFVWKYLWGPIVADAQRQPQGDISEGYNVVNTLVYALVLAVAVIGIWRVFSYLGIRLDAAFLVAMVPWVVLGSVLRALEDAGLFSRDGVLVYLFVSPVIYMLVGLLAVGLVIASHFIEAEAARVDLRRGPMWALYVLLCLNVVPGLVHFLAPDQMAVHAPYWVLPAISVAGLLVLWWWSRREGGFPMTAQVATYGAVLAAMALWYALLRASGRGWAETERGLASAELVIIPAIAAACTLASAGLFWVLSRRWGDARAFLVPVALLLFASHFLDGAATYRGVDFHGYSEKHVLPGFLIELTGTAAVMLPLKFLVVAMVVYLMDVAYRRDLEDSPNLGWLVKVAVLVLGLAPGTRDMLRLAMGV